MSSVTVTESFNNITSSIILSFLNTTSSSSPSSTLITDKVNANSTVDEINNQTDFSTPPTLPPTWITQLINSNDSTMPIQCSMLMNQSDHFSLMLNDTNQNNILDQFNNQSKYKKFIHLNYKLPLC